jgi:hypothetical protein
MFRFWHKADISVSLSDVRFLGEERTSTTGNAASDPKRTSALLPCRTASWSYDDEPRCCWPIRIRIILEPTIRTKSKLPTIRSRGTINPLKGSIEKKSNNGTGVMSDNHPARDVDRHEAFLAAEKAKAAAEQERRRQRLTKIRVTSAPKVEPPQITVLPDGEVFDPWMNLLRGLEKRSGVARYFDADGNVELRVRTRHLLTAILCVDPERINGSSQGTRLGRCMRALGWRGPVDLRFGGLKGKGYAKTLTDDQSDISVGSGGGDTSQPQALAASCAD